MPGRPGLTHGVGSAGWAGPRHVRLQLRHPSPPRGLLCAHPSRARTHTWPRLAGRAEQDPQERPDQKPAARASAEGGRPGGHSTWGRGVGRVRSRRPVEAICPWAWPAVPAQGTQVPPRPCPELQQGRVWPRGGCLPVTTAPASPHTPTPGITPLPPCPAPSALALTTTWLCPLLAVLQLPINCSER